MTGEVRNACPSGKVGLMRGYFEINLPDGRTALITPRQRDVLVALCRPLSSGDPFPQPSSVRQIAAALVVTEAAVKQHLLSLYDSLGIADGDNRRLRLAIEAIRLGAVDLETSPAGSAVAPAPGVGRARSAAELESQADDALWSAHVDQSAAIREQAHDIARRAGDLEASARTALGLVVDNILLARPSAAGGWLAAAQRILADAPPSIEHGRLAWTLALIQTASGQPEAGLANATTAFEIAGSLGDRDLSTLALAFQGLAHVHLGRVDQGLRLLDEAMAAAMTGDLGPIATGLTYCRTMSACLDLFDYRRASEWTEAIQRGAARGHSIGFPGDCSTHRLALLIVRGKWTEASEEAIVACSTARELDLNHVALALAELGDLRLRQGALDLAADAYRQAHELGTDAQPGLALLALAQGSVEAALESIGAAASRLGQDPLARAHLLPAVVAVSIAAGRLEAAAAAAADLARIAELHATPALVGASAGAMADVALARDEAEPAAEAYRTAIQGWLEAGAPYDVALARLGLARALRASGLTSLAHDEAEAARSTFSRLGASRDETAARAVLDELASGRR
jgi:hypothetical protein